MKLITVSILLIVGFGVPSDAHALISDISDVNNVHFPPANSNAEPCNNVANGLSSSSQTKCVVFEDTQRDFHLEIGHRKILAHANAIAGSIPYFEGPRGELQSKIERLMQQNLDSSAVEGLLRFAYTRQIQINDDNLDAVLKAATYLQMENVIAACMDLLLNRINDNNVIHTLNTATTSNDTAIVTVARKYFLANILRLSKSIDFPELTADALAAVVRSNANPTTPDESLFDAILGWTNHHNQSAIPCELIEYIRFCSMTLVYLGQHVLPKLQLIDHCSQVRQTIENSIVYQIEPNVEHARDCKTLHDEQRRQNAKFWTMQLAGDDIKMQVFQPASNRTGMLHNGPPSWFYSVVVHNCNIYAIGGRSGDRKTEHVFNEASNEWRAIASMNEEREFASAVEVNGIIYVCGGTGLASAESYDTRSETWNTLASMEETRSGHRLVALDDHLYAIGGHGRLNSVEKYDISRNEWTQVEPMLKARVQFGAAVLNKKIYVCGGDDSYKSAEVFDPIHQQWTAIAPMSNEHYHFSLIPYMDQLWAFPGTEIYEPKTNSWTPHPYKWEHGESVVSVLTQC